MYYKHIHTFLVLFVLFTSFSLNCKKKSHIVEPVTTESIHKPNDADGLGLITQDHLRELFESSPYEMRTFDTKTGTWLINFKLTDGSTITVRNHNGIYAVSTGNYARGDLVIYVFDRDLPISALGTTQLGRPTPKSFVDSSIIRKLQELFVTEVFQDQTLHSRVGIVFDEVPSEKNPVTNSFDVYITRSDLTALENYQRHGTELPDMVMKKLNKLNQLLIKKPDLFVRLIGHGSIGSNSLQGDDLVSRPLSYYPKQLRAMLGLNAQIARIHLDLDSCYGGACSLDGGKSMLGTSLEEFKKLFPQATIQGVASPSSVNYSANPRVKLIWMPQLKNGVWELIPVDLHTVIGGYVDANLDSEGKLQYSVVGVSDKFVKRSSPALKALVDARAAIIKKMPEVEKAQKTTVSETKYKTATAAQVLEARSGRADNHAAQIFAQLQSIEEMFHGLIEGSLTETRALSLCEQLKSWQIGNPVIEKPIFVTMPERQVSPIKVKEPALADSPSPPKQVLDSPKLVTESPKPIIESPKADSPQRLKSPVLIAPIGNPFIQNRKISSQAEAKGKIGVGIGVAMTAAFSALGSLGVEVLVNHQ